MADADRGLSPSDERGQPACPWCGAPNPAGAQRCASCGSWLVSDVDPATEGTLIDVSGGEPRIVEAAPSAPSGGYVWYSSGRGMVVRGGRRGCLLIGLALLLLLICQCVIAWFALRWIFG